MSAAGNPVRADLATVAPMYYPIIEKARFASVAALCKRNRWPLKEVQQHCTLAAINRSDVAVIDQIQPGENMRAVLILQPGGAVILCAGLFGDLTESREEAEAIAQQFAALPEFKGKLCAVGEFRANAKGAGA